MSVFSVRINLLNQAAAKYSRVINEIDVQQRNYSNLIQETDNSWDGLASRAFINRMRTEGRKLSHMRNYAVALRKYCKTTAEKMEAVDRMLRKLMERINSVFNNNQSNSSATGSATNDKLYTYGNQQYTSIPNFSKYAMKQDLNIGNCTAVAWCMGRSMYTGQTCDPYSSTYWNPNSGAIYTGYQSVINSNQFATMYNELAKGKPSMFYAYNGNNISGNHAVTIVGVTSNADASNLSAKDFLCIDPGDGAIKNLSEVGFHNYNGTVYTYA